MNVLLNIAIKNHKTVVKRLTELIRIINIFLLLGIIHSTAWSQFYPAKVYSIRDGMPTNAIFDITQANDGIMWFMTSKGVVNYNSLKWHLFSDSLQLPNSPYSYIRALEDGSVWTAGQNSNDFVIKYYKNENWQSVKLEGIEKIEGKFTFDVRLNNSGYSIIIGGRNTIYLHETSSSTLQKYQLSDNPYYRINSIKFHNKIAYISTSEGLYTLNNSISSHPINQHLEINDEVLQIHWDKKDLYLLGINWLALYQDDEFKYLSNDTGVNSSSRFNKHNLTVDRFGRIFYSSMSSAQFLDRSTGYGKILYINGRVFNAQSNRIYVDTENNVWVGDHRGLFKFNVLRFQNYNENIGLANDEVTAITYHDQQLILANQNQLNFLENGNIVKKLNIGFKAGIRILDLATNGSNQLFIAANSAGLKLYDGQEVINLDWKTKNEDHVVTSVEFINDKLYYSTNVALYSYEEGVIKKEVKVPYIRNISQLNKDTIAALSTSEGLFLYNPSTKNIQQFTSSSRIYNNVYNVCKWNDQYFIGTSGGLAVIKNKQIVPFFTSEKLNRVAIYSLFVSKNNNLWLGTNEGIFIWDGMDITNYNKAHGLVGDEINRNAFLQINKEEVWIGTEMGASVYNFDEDLSTELIPNLQLKKAETLEGSVLTESQNILKHDNNTIEFQFLGVSYFDENQINYRYKLNGFDEDWLYIDNPNSNSVRYTNLPPGDFEFLVESSLDNNNWSVPKSLSFTIEKPFYYTYWFVAISIIGVLILLYSIYRIRFYFILKNQQKLKKEVKLRTQEIQRMNDEIQAQNEELISQSEEIATNNERLEEIVQDRTRKLREQNDRLSKYAFMNSHELRGPICRMIGLLNLLKLSQQTEYEKILSLIQETGKELDIITRHINKLLDNVDLSDLQEANSIEVINANNREQDQIDDNIN
ncbi:ligand-binding sensor domain-containing protein [Marivirga arenosa]|uniref:Triple tyrosine motif-containing protein n=1 Tax=Marivirga arenosa TaxID=3059076 RepID=A0AA51X3Z4_9BACT|nr:triple tyrosine motif-containing protein [Marivirga sp. BKB1-2]WNB17063.1 triple tyrosine motif-containing protein [Marivirga sp. BKB1-2]